MVKENKCCQNWRRINGNIKKYQVALNEGVIIGINTCRKSQEFIANLRELAAAVCQVILLKFLIRFPA